MKANALQRRAARLSKRSGAKRGASLEGATIADATQRSPSAHQTTAVPVRTQTLPALVGVAGAVGYFGSERSRRRRRVWAYVTSRLGLGLIGTSIVASTQQHVLQANVLLEGQSMGTGSGSWMLGLLAPALCAGSVLAFRLLMRRMPKRRTWLPSALWAFAAVAVLTMIAPASPASAAALGPQKHIYNGRLLNSSGNPVTTSQSIRFSYWKSEDFLSGDVTTGGAINTGAANYASWYEVQNVVPDSNGYFSLKMGSGTALPSLSSYNPLDLDDLFLQVEVKPTSSADTAYELLDVNPSNSAVDRGAILSVPFSLNADMIDQRDVGTGSGSIPVLQTGGVLAKSAIPGGTNSGTFILDVDNTESSTINLQFGGTLAKKLTYDIANGRFNFNDDVRVEGDLTVTGLINNIDLSRLSAGSGNYLRASSGGGLNLKIGQGDYRINGNVTHFAGTSALVLPNNTTSNVYFTGTGITATTGSFPNDKSYIPVAQIVTAGGGISTITDKRIFSSDNREQTIERMFTPGYEHASFQGDASDNVGQLSMSHDNTNDHNFYMWTSTKSSLQDYDVFVRVPLSSDFEHWDASAPLQIAYRSTSATASNNALAVQVYDTNGQPVTLGGSSSGLASTSWATSSITFGGGTWTPGQEFLVKFTFKAKDNFQMQLGKMRLKYVDLLVE